MNREKYDFGTLTFGNRFIIGEMREGADVQLETVSRIIEIAHARFNGEHWAYISNRVNSYSANPIVHIEAPKFEKKMVAFAVVANDQLRRRIVEIEKSISTGQYKFDCFVDLDAAIAWVTQVLNEESHQA